MKFSALIFLVCLTVDSAFSSGNDGRPLSGNNGSSEQLDTCPNDSSVTVKVFRNQRGEWLTSFVSQNKLSDLNKSIHFNLQRKVLECDGDSSLISVSGFLIDKEAGNSSDVSTGDFRENISGGDYDCCKRSIESPTRDDIAFINKTLGDNIITARNSSNAIVAIEDRLSSLENTLKSLEGAINQIRDTLGKIPRYGYYTPFDASIKGKYIKFSNNFLTATRTIPLNENKTHGGVISNDLLKDDQVFQFRIDEVMYEVTRSGLSMGITTQKYSDMNGIGYILDCAGTWSINSPGVTTTRKSDTWKDGKAISRDIYPLSTRRLPVGTMIGISRRSNGELRFYIDGEDKGAAFSDVPRDVYAYVDVSDYVSQITIVN